MKKHNKIFAVAIIILLVLFLVYYHLSYYAALAGIDFPNGRTRDIFQGIDPNGHEYRVVLREEDGVGDAFALLTKNSVGIWELSMVNDKKSAYGTVQTAWIDVSGFARYGEADDITHMFEFHEAYAGNNAAAPLENIAGLLPAGMAVELQQAGSAYTLHFVYYGKSWPLTETGIMDILAQNGYIDPSLNSSDNTGIAAANNAADG
jgi:hypothetical protein